ncbi:ornithine cyclodeaminase family protein [Pseudomonas sp. LFM046]|uniref:ornithine cyclodeaminase family protein n=1 Tax=Pseudomonas sp. LFM046 TaxID=1608357 RepID=UPI0005CFE04C|nr:ornithine cyclodeaminase family protein [Pseudomonas sp. LFM046]
MHSLSFFTNADVAAALGYPQLIEALRQGLATPADAPVRASHALPHDASLLCMPVWQQGQGVGVKLVTVFPHNGEKGLPSVAALFTLFDDATGQPRAVLEASELTARRTACTSALAASALARQDASRLLVVGTGTLAAHMVRAHSVVREYQRVDIWGRHPDKTAELVRQLAAEGYPVHVAPDLQTCAQQADCISCVTTSTSPLILGDWLRPGTHLDLVGAFLPTMRETDSAAVARSRIVVDTRAGALEEAGDLLLAIAEGAITEQNIHFELADLLHGRGHRQGDSEITLFKSVGYALEDLIAAKLLLSNAG